MILTALKELAEREGLNVNPDFDPCEVRWLVAITPTGSLLGDFQDTLQTSGGKGKTRQRAKVFEIPKRSKRTTQNEAEFLVDKAEYVFGWGENEKRARKRHELYRDEVRRALEATSDEALAALLRFLESLSRGDVCLAQPEDWEEGDLIGFQYSEDPDGPRLISSRPKVREYWHQRRLERDAGASEPRQCLVTGQLCVPVRLHPDLKGIPPVSETKGGVPLTSVNGEAFGSYGLEEIGCAPVSLEAADAYEKALNRLLAEGYPNPKDRTPMPRRNFRLSGATIVVFWGRSESAALDLFAESIHDADPEAVAALYGATWKGRQVDLADPSAFYALTLSGGKGRASVRGWFESTVRDVMGNVREHFDDLKIVGPGGKLQQSFPLWQLLRGTAVQGKDENIAPNLAAVVFEVVLKGWSYPRMLLDASIRQFRRAEKDKKKELYATLERAALIKAYLARAKRLKQLDSIYPDFPEVKPMLDKDCTARAYRLGRLFAVLEKLQADATNATTTIRDRFYGAASATPAVVFPQLMRKAPHHYKNSGRPVFYETLVQQIFCALQPPHPFPPTLTLEEQGLFAVGYYHQRQDLFTKRSGTDGDDDAAPATDDNSASSEGE
jgi:CRISPR-associated protein Csd1